MRARTVEAILGVLPASRPVRKSELQCGDRLIVTTENSVYSMTALGDSTFSVRGGWFDRQGLSPLRISIAGCTWGGTVIRVDVAAAAGLRLEFGNRVVTSKIREIRVLRSGETASLRPCRVEELLRACYGNDWKSAAAA